MSYQSSAGFTDLIGPMLREVDLRPVEVRYQGLADAQPSPVSIPAISPRAPSAEQPNISFLQPKVATPSRLGSLASKAASELVRPFSLRANSRWATITFLCLAAFLVWLGYGAVPGLSEAMPLSSATGIIYFATLLPASLFTSALILAAGRGLGWGLEQLALRRGK